MRLAQFQIVLLVGFMYLASSASAQKGTGGGKDDAREGGRAANNTPQRGRGNDVDRTKDGPRNDADRAKSAVRDNVGRSNFAVPNSAGRRGGGADSNMQPGAGNLGKALQDPGRTVDRNANGTVNNLRRNDPRQNDPRLGNTRPGAGTAPRNLGGADVRVTPRVNMGGPKVNIAGPNAWRYQQHNNRWWYWMPNNSWVYWNNGAWLPYSALAGSRYYNRPYSSGYRGTDSFAGGYLGVSFNPQYRNVAVISQVNANSPAEAAGLQRGDVIRTVNGRKIRSAHESSSMIRQYAPRTEVTLSIERDRQMADVLVVLGQR